MLSPMLTGKRTLAVLALVTAALVGAGVYAWRDANTWGFRRDLPPGAEDVHETFWEDGFLPDYKYQLRATMSVAEYRSYVARLGCTPHTSERIYSDDGASSPEWPRGPTEPMWWHPSQSLEGTCVYQARDSWILAKYEHGYLYLYAMNH